MTSELPQSPAKYAKKKGPFAKITRVILWLGSAVALGFCWGVVETLVVRTAFHSGPYLHRDFVHALNGPVIFYTIFTLLLSAFLTAVIWSWRRLRHKPLHLRAAGRYALIASAATGAYVNLALAVFPYWRDKYEFAKRAPELALLTALSAAAALVAGILILAWLRRRSLLFRRASRFTSYFIMATALAVGVSSLAYQQYRLVARPSPAELPDVVVITLDAWRADAFNEDLTPNLYNYARNNGLIFTNARVFSSWTLPSFAATLTGTFNITNAHGTKTPDDDIPAWAEVMRDNGYDTYAILSNPHLDNVRSYFRGFTHFYYDEYRTLLYHIRFYDTAAYFTIRGKKYRSEIPGDPTRRLTEKTCALLRRPSRRPKFVWVHILDPHFPYQPLPAILKQEAPALVGKAQYGTEIKALKKDNARILAKLYEEEVRSTDFLLAPLLSELQARKNTLVIISSDHGEEFFEHGGKEHGRTLYDEVCKVPLVAALPRGGGPRERVGIIKEPVSLIDVAPSVLDYVAFPVPPTMEGRPDLFAQNRPLNRTVYLYLNRSGAEVDALVEGNKKIIATKTKGRVAIEYYDLEADPGEKKPLPLDEEGERLRRGILEWARMRGAAPATGDRSSPFGKRADLEALGYI